MTTILQSIVMGAGFCIGFAITGVLFITVIAIIGMIIQELEE